MLKFILTLALAALLHPALAADSFDPRDFYEDVTPAVETTSSPGKVEVVELFWYGCPHCFAFEPSIEKWLKDKAEYIEFKRVPAVFASNWEVHARAFYAAEQLGILQQTHSLLFAALHDQSRKLFSEEELAKFYAEHGVTEAAFHEAYNSFDVDTKTRNAISLTRKYGITGVPAVIVNGKYRSSAQKAGTYANLLKLVDALAAKEAGQ